MIETGKWNVFSENLLTDGRTARSALTEIENRHKELLELEGRIKDIHDLFFHMAMLVEEQGCMLENIEANVCATQDYVVKSTAHIRKAVKYKKNNPYRFVYIVQLSSMLATLLASMLGLAFIRSVSQE
uniref:Syntaxin 11a n=1 Tax=Myripristis murdjan TaxID=586833 RepID=A0A668AB03_9TELE